MFTKQDVQEFVKFGVNLKKIEGKNANTASFFDEKSGVTFSPSLDSQGNYVPEKTDSKFLFAAFSYSIVDATKQMIEENELNLKSLDFRDGKFEEEYENIDNKMIEKFASSMVEPLNEISQKLIPLLKHDYIKKIDVSSKNYYMGGKQILETFAKTDQNFDCLCNVVLEKFNENNRVKTRKMQGNGKNFRVIDSFVPKKEQENTFKQ